MIESTCLVTSLHLFKASQNMPKKGQQEKILFFTLNKGQFDVKEFYILHSLEKSARF